ncbi:MAG: VWA domain-containing protein [Muribaculaceae bacterium]|nr:VWA domain-containing protein [Muribaculaceae bacterium]
MDTKPEQTNVNAEKRTTIYNVIILDKSGSMTSIAPQAISGVNETLAAIRCAQLKDPSLDNRVTLVAFCGCELKKIYDMTPIAEAHDISANDYCPCCMTPLYDAVGQTITHVHQATTGQLVAVAVTIITDGYENASREFDGKTIKKLIDQYKDEGWMFAYIGADHDVEAVAAKMSIDNHMAFDKTAAGTTSMFCRERSSKMRWINKMKQAINSNEDEEAARKEMRENNSDYFPF